MSEAQPTENITYQKLSPFSHSEVCCSVWNAALSEALRRLGYYARRVNSPLSVPRAPQAVSLGGVKKSLGGFGFLPPLRPSPRTPP